MYFTESERDSDRQILQFVENLERHGLGCDGFHLSSGYTTQQGKRCVFCWNNDRFPDPEAFLHRMEELGVPMSPNIKPALLTEHPLYGEFRNGNAFFTDPETGRPSLERYWGGWASLVDFTSEGGRALWKKHLTRSLLVKGARSLWDDNNEYEIFDEQAMCAGDGTPCPAVQLKPVFANLMAQTGIEALGEFDPEARPYVLSRAGYAGIQRYAQTWAGDNYTSWNDLKYNIPVMLGMGLSGVANQGCDVGGFQGPASDGELFVRWVENGIFQPRFCIHSCNTDNTVTRPLSYGSLTSYVQSAFRLRYALGLYLYSCMRQSNLLGDPVMRALPYEFGDDPQATSDFDFMFGPWLLVANVLEPGAVERTVYLPAGCDWYDWHTHRRYAGGQTVCVPAPMGRIPLFYRSGCILPLIAPAQHMQLGKLPLIRLLVEESCDSSFVLYQDDGKTNRWRLGDYLETAVSTRVEAGATNLCFACSGNWDCGPRSFEIELVHVDCAPLNVRLNGRPLPMLLEADAYEAAQEGWYFDLETRHACIRVQDPGTDFCLRADYQIKDLVAM